MIKKDKNYMQQLVDYIKKNLAKGYTMDSLRWALINQGHSKVEVSKAISLANEDLSRQAPVLREKPVINVETLPPVEEKPSFFGKVKSWFS